MGHWMGRAKTRTQQKCDVDAIVGCSRAKEEEEDSLRQPADVSKMGRLPPLFPFVIGTHRAS